MGPLLLGVFAASLVGSLHCAGMCGPLIAFVIGGGAGTDSRGSIRLQLGYHGARGVAYVALGLVLGMAGHLLDIAGVLAGLAPLAATLAGVTLIITGLALVARHFGAAIPKARVPAPIQDAIRGFQARALKLPPMTRALSIGATSALLPCGWLYAFAITAAGTGEPLFGALVMGAFWLGTVPILGALGFGIHGIQGALAPKLRFAASLALVTLGAWTLLGRAQLDAGAIARAVQSSKEAQAATQVEPAPGLEGPMPCCADTTEGADE